MWPSAAPQVHSTIASVVLPEAERLQGSGGVYAWLQKLLQDVWVDPVCGDGRCEAPFEFASFSRFGCKADCGRLSDIQNLTSAQVDVYWDFSHQASSLPASELMRQASWNLCPQAIGFSTACYEDPDPGFASIAGSVSRPMPDLPDGDWAVVVKRDIFHKTRGAVRDTAKLEAAAFWYRAYVAASAADAEQAYELGLLRAALSLLDVSLLDALPAVWASPGSGQAGRDAFDAQQMANATCLCGAPAAELLEGTWGYAGEAAYRATNCTGASTLGERSWDADGAASITWHADPPPAPACEAAVANLTLQRAALNASVLDLLVAQRLGNLRDTGKFGARAAAAERLRAALADSYPELLPGVFTSPRGADPAQPRVARWDVLAHLFVESPAFLVGGAPAHLALFRRRLTQDPGLTFIEYASRARARVTEIAAQAAAVDAIQLEAPDGTRASVGELKAAFAAAGANASWLPPAPELGPVLGVEYNLASWGGNTTAYLTCNLELRGPEFLGTCRTMPVTCAAASNDSAPWACTRAGDNSSVGGTLQDAAYRRDCELPCDRQADCGALCECWGACGGGEYCACRACAALAPDAAADSQFFTIQDAAASAGAAQADLIAATGGAPGRRLQQAADTTAQLAAVLARVDELRAAQGSVTGQLDALQSQVDRANLLAEARAASSTLADVVAAGRVDIQAGQASLEGKLNTLLQRQQAALDAMAAASSQLAAIQSLSQRQADALAGLEAATNERLAAIAVATQQGIISLHQALSVWKLARRERALSNKVSKLAGSPCSFEAAEVRFSLANGNSAAPEAARERSLGLHNRVLGGLLLHTWRREAAACPETRFSAIQSICSGRPDTSPFGVDSVFKLGSPNFSPDLYDPDGTMLTAIYNCSQLAAPTYGLTDPVTRLATNPPPFCAELFNPRGVPYAFRHLPLPGLPPGFPLLFDVNLSEEGAQTWLSWVQEGLLLDESTAGLQARLVTYNAQLRVFGSVLVSFDFQPGGSIKVSHRIYTLSLELYDPTPAHLARYAAEVLLAAGIVLLCLLQLWDVAACVLTARGRRQGGLAAYFSSGSNWLQLANNALLLAGCGLWWTFVNSHAKAFSMALRYPVYAELQPRAHFLHLADAEGAGIARLAAAFAALDAAIACLSWYYALNGISILLLIARLLRAMDFQPRLGVVTRALALAGPDLLHFFLVAGSVFVCYCLMGFLIFGNSLHWFATLGNSVNTCFEMLLGEFADVNADLRALGGLQALAGAAFFWSFQLLVFLILLNFLLAIIVDAFGEVKAGTAETTGIHVELPRLLLDKWRGLAGAWGGRYVGAARLDDLMRGWAGVVEEEEAAVAAAAAARAAAAAAAASDSDGWELGGGGGAGGSEPRVLQVAGEAVDEAALAQMLLAVAAEQRAGAPVAGGGAKAGGEAQAAEAAAAARFAVRRFGSSARRVAQQALQEAHPPAHARARAPSCAPGRLHTPARAAQLGPGGRELERERDRLAAALEQLAEVQRELADAQRALMAGQKQLAEQQGALLGQAGRPPAG